MPSARCNVSVSLWHWATPESFATTKGFLVATFALLLLKDIDCNSWQGAWCNIALWYWQPLMAATAKANFCCLCQRMSIATHGKVQYCFVVLATAKDYFPRCQWHSLPLLVPKDTNCNLQQSAMLTPMEYIVSLHVPLMPG